MQYSHSRVECHQKCPYQFKLRYVDELTTIHDPEPDDALVLGTAMHEGIENGTEAGVNAYYQSFAIVDDRHINETMKLEYLIPRVRDLLPSGQYEVPIELLGFHGFIDLLTDEMDIYDFKYSNNVDNYMDSDQLHVYKYFYEKATGQTIRNLFFVFIPKVKIKQKKTETLYQFRQRLLSELEDSQVKIVQIKYDQAKVERFYEGIRSIMESTDYPKNPSYLCNWCQYQQLCEGGIDYMILPSNKRREIESAKKRTIWVYGSPFTGKTTFANQAPDPLMLNTDGNIKFVDAPFIPIKDVVTVEGRQTKRKMAWEVFKESIDELEKKQNDFKTIIVDLLEDTYEHCRLYMYDKLNITHESDDSFSAWDKVRTEFFSTLKRLMNLDYENIILISHDDRSRDLTKKGGDKITSIMPNMNEKVAKKVAGMVDIVARANADGGEHTLSFKTNEVIFGGGRLRSTVDTIPLNFSEFCKIYDSANPSDQKVQKVEARTRKTEPVTEVAPDTEPIVEPIIPISQEVVPIDATTFRETTGRRSRKNPDDVSGRPDGTEQRSGTDDVTVAPVEATSTVTAQPIEARRSRRTAEPTTPEPVTEVKPEVTTEPVRRTRKRREE